LAHNNPMSGPIWAARRARLRFRTIP